MRPDDARPAETPERCERCRFDGTAYTDDDVAGTLAALGTWWRLTIADIDDPVLHRRPAETIWSPVEYLRHTAAVTHLIAGLLASADDESPLEVELPSVDEIADGRFAGPLELDREIQELELDAQRVAQLVRGRGEHQPLDRVFIVGSEPISGRWLARHIVHEAIHHLSDVGRDLYRLVGKAAPLALGRVESVNVSDGGVPKHPVDSAQLGSSGLSGDRQVSRRHHGRPWQALCLWSADVLDALVEEGHPIAPGAAGENLTLRGIDWVAMRPGVRLQLGDALVELTVPATPCAKNAKWFHDGDVTRIDHDRCPGWSRWYARTIRDGAVSVGSTVVVEPDRAPSGDR